MELLKGGAVIVKLSKRDANFLKKTLNRGNESMALYEAILDYRGVEARRRKNRKFKLNKLGRSLIKSNTKRIVINPTAKFEGMNKIVLRNYPKYLEVVDDFRT